MNPHFLINDEDYQIAPESNLVVNSGEISLYLWSSDEYYLYYEKKRVEFRISRIKFPSPVFKRTIIYSEAENDWNMKMNIFSEKAYLDISFPSYINGKFLGTIHVNEEGICIDGYVQLRGVGGSHDIKISIYFPVTNEIVQDFESKFLPGYQFTNLYEIENTDSQYIRRVELRIDTSTDYEKLEKCFSKLVMAKTVFVRLNGAKFFKGFENLKSVEHLSISFSGQTIATDLPPEIYTLTTLKILNLIGVVDKIDASIGNLENLEILQILEASFTEFPEQMKNLTNLRNASFQQCGLTDFPGWIIDSWKNLQKLDLTGNKFERLPSELATVPKVVIEQELKKLYKSTSYQTIHSNEIDDTIFHIDANERLANKLKEKIIQYGLESYSTELFLSARKAVSYRISELASTVGQSKLGGAPDVPEDFTHPTTDGLYWSFLGQINLEEISGLQQYMPRQGMLSFFCSDPNYAFDKEYPLQKEIKVFHFKKEQFPLKPFVYPENASFSDQMLSDGILYNSYAIIPQSVISLPFLYMGERTLTKETERLLEIDRFGEEYDKLDKLAEELIDCEDRNYLATNAYVFTQLDLPEQECADEKGGTREEWMTLMTFDSCKKIAFQFGDCGSLTFCIHKKDLAAEDFSNVLAVTYSS